MAITEVENHTKRENIEAKGNALADYFAKQAAQTMAFCVFILF